MSPPRSRPAPVRFDKEANQSAVVASCPGVTNGYPGTAVEPQRAGFAVTIRVRLQFEPLIGPGSLTRASLNLTEFEL
jgi:hypothetical protein